MGKIHKKSKVELKLCRRVYAMDKIIQAFLHRALLNFLEWIFFSFDSFDSFAVSSGETRENQNYPVDVNSLQVRAKRGLATSGEEDAIEFQSTTKTYQTCSKTIKIPLHDSTMLGIYVDLKAYHSLLDDDTKNIIMELYLDFYEKGSDIQLQLYQIDLMMTILSYLTDGLIHVERFVDGKNYFKSTTQSFDLNEKFIKTFNVLDLL